MLSRPTVQSRPTCLPGSAWYVSLCHMLLITLVCGLHGARCVWAQSAYSTPQVDVNKSQHGPDDGCSLRGFDVRAVCWGDGSGVPKSGNNVVFVGIDCRGLLRIRIFDACDNAITDTVETELPATRVGAIATLKQRLPGWVPPHCLTKDEKDKLIDVVTAIVPQYSLHEKYSPVKFESFLIEANWGEGRFVGELKRALEELIAWVHDEEPYTKRANIVGYEVNRVTAPPGYGKSALLRYLVDILKRNVNGSRPDEIRGQVPNRDDKFFQDHISLIKLDELESAFGVRSTMLDDLKDEDGTLRAPFGKLRAFDYDDHAAPGLEFLVHEFDRNTKYKDPTLSASILIIDSIDELHPDSAKSLLKRIDDCIRLRDEKDRQVEPSRRGFLRVFVVGCSEGFTDYYRIAQGGVPKAAPIRLREPCFRSCDDLVCAGMSVVQFNVLGGNSDPKVEEEMTRRAICFVKKHPWLERSFYNLSAFGDLMRFSNIYINGLRPPRSFRDEYQLQEVFFESLLARAHNTYNRPASRSQEYLFLLEQIACKFAGRRQIDKEGYFMLTPNDFVEIEVNVGKHCQTVSYLAEAVLNRSGVVDLNSVDRFPRYRFYPGWVRTHLLERHRRRLMELAEHGNCARRSCCP
jgi:hypothetical protein